ncbi:MAG: hypothetical protein PHF86_03225 [Candidatus Nanoarchaeia archaeon]|nr:hypothetical protein [Candidatus Nanoarchaeia archaeon]
MINELTNDQEKLLSVYKKKWIDIGLSTKTISDDECKSIINNLYKHVLKYDPPTIIIMNNPITTWFATLLLQTKKDQVENQVHDQVGNQVHDQVHDQVRDQVRNQVGNRVFNQVGNQVFNQVGNQVQNQVRNQVRDQVHDQVHDQVGNRVFNQVRDQVHDQVHDQVRDQVENQVENQVWDQVGNQVRDQVENQVRDQVWDQVGNRVWDQVGNQVRDQVENQVENQVWDQVGNRVFNQVHDQVHDQVGNRVFNQVRDQVRENVKKVVFPYMQGHWDTGYFSFYDYMQNVLNIKLVPSFNYYLETSKLDFIYPLKDFCVVCRKPISYTFNNTNVLHNESGPAIKYKDDFEIYCLNGVTVKKEIVMTPWDELDSNLVRTETNVEIRREIVRKIGIEKICKDLHAKIIDNKDNYELLLLDNRPYLKMLNPSIGVYHVEGVPLECKTVEDALNSRKPEKLRRIPIDEEGGSNWYQQGDVCVWPSNAKTVKNKPIILT